MNWLTPAIISCACWGIATILLDKVVGTKQTGSMTLIFYEATIFTTMLIGFFFQYKPGDIASASFKTATLTMIAGACSGVALLSILYAYQTWRAQIPWISIIGNLSPVIVIGYLLCTGLKPTGWQWTGIFFAMIAIICLRMPSK